MSVLTASETVERRECDFPFDWAEDYWQHGFNVVGVIPGTKRPLAMWKGLQKRRVTEEDLRRWFIDTQGLGIAVITGRISGITVVDFEKQALDLARDFWREHPTALISRTGGGGVHLFYKYAPGGNRVKVGGKPMDVRNDGGVIVLPYTVHPETGQSYAWVTWPVDTDKVPTFDPAWLAESGPLVSQEVRNGRSYISSIVAVSGEGGHNATFRAACKLRDAGLSEAESLGAMIQWNQTNAEPAWELQDLVHKVRDAFRSASNGLQQQEKWMQKCMDGECCTGMRHSKTKKEKAK